MKVLVDTSVWSLAFRRNQDQLNAEQKIVVDLLMRLISDNNALMVGPVRQELLSGIRDRRIFDGLRGEARHFSDLPIQTSDYETAAEFRNICLSLGLAAKSIDILICAVAARTRYPILTLDKAFQKYSEHLNVPLYRYRITPD